MENKAIGSQKIYSRRGVMLGSFFGSVLCGAYLTAQNLKAEGRKSEVKKTWLIAVAIAFVGVLVLFAIKAMIGIRLGTPIGVAQVLGFLFFYDKLFSKEDLLNRERFSNWRAFGIALLFLIAIFTPAALMFTAYLIFQRA